jgi:phosphoribosylformylglycinamidine synthase subunit PurQ / glutaminase
MKSAVIVFPGSNCDRDALTVLAANGLNPQKVWHAETRLPKVDLVVLPGGFSYGDYLRSGAMAAHAPIMAEVKKHVSAGGYALGICNGFQILTEAQLLPGMLMRNAKLKFICRPVGLTVETTSSTFTKAYQKGQVINVPVAHHDGNYYADADTLKRLNADERVAFRYTENINGSVENIAGILSENKRVLGMMPHPERHAEAIIGGLDGKALFQALVAA